MNGRKNTSVPSMPGSRTTCGCRFVGIEAGMRRRTPSAAHDDTNQRSHACALHPWRALLGLWASIAVACAGAHTQPEPLAVDQAPRSPRAATPVPALGNAAPPLTAAAQPKTRAADPGVRRVLRLTILGEFPREVIPEIEAALREQLQV